MVHCVYSDQTYISNVSTHTRKESLSAYLGRDDKGHDECHRGHRAIFNIITFPEVSATHQSQVDHTRSGSRRSGSSGEG